MGKDNAYDLTFIFYALVILITIIIVGYIGICIYNKFNNPSKCGNNGEGLVADVDSIGYSFGFGKLICSICAPIGGSYVNSSNVCVKCEDDTIWDGTKCVRCADGDTLDKRTFTCNTPPP